MEAQAQRGATFFRCRSCEPNSDFKTVPSLQFEVGVGELLSPKPLEWMR